MDSVLLLVLAGSSGPGAPAPIVQDTFTDANGTSIENHISEVGGPWTRVGSTAQIQTNRLWTWVNGVICHLNPGQKNIDATVLLDKSDPDGVVQPGVILRGSGAGAATHLWIRDIGRTTIFLSQDDYTDLASAGIGWIGNEATLRHTDSAGNEVNIYWDGVLRITHTTAYNNTGTLYGFKEQGGQIIYDDLEIVAF